jgi:hypothetical protein
MNQSFNTSLQLNKCSEISDASHGAAHAAIAASVLHAAGLDARPVLEGGLAEWRSRGGETTNFRRCGS